ncbi:protein SMALL AUXIN UP-REGULATED RNA 51 [Ziziphus jujuba]|uniref:Protein SMALL AUXIN UP-REGULATED RNA 51 n=1 Tax=Ziziphus jujuba TaxID=326968 RepID=A0A6P4AKM5_ZIZJJ|nr:protein SMALL AUXIN UP-REGULATED RNA 51 [Ziziphus jujuba]
MAGAMVHKISQIVRLKQLMLRWKHVSVRRRPVYCSDSEPHAAAVANDPTSRRIPSGFLAVYVGSTERRRFLIPARFLNLPVFVALLKKAEEEFGFECSGGLVLPCEVGFFEEILRFLQKSETKFGKFGLDDFLKMTSDVGFDSCREISTNNMSHAFTPLLQKARV